MSNTIEITNMTDKDLDALLGVNGVTAESVTEALADAGIEAEVEWSYGVSAGAVAVTVGQGLVRVAIQGGRASILEESIRKYAHRKFPSPAILRVEKVLASVQ